MHTRPLLSLPPLFALILAIVLPTSAWAGTALVSGTGGPLMHYEYGDGVLRMGEDGGNSYSLLRDGKMYMVSLEDESPMVIDASAFMQGFMSGMGQTMDTGQLTEEVLSIDETGRAEIVAGIAGEVYRVHLREEDGSERFEEAVLSDDPRVRAFTAALFQMVGLATQMAGEEAAANADALRQMLDAMEMGILRAGSDMSVEQISDEMVPAERFVLPAEPMDFSALGGLLGGAAAAMGNDAPEDKSGQREEGLRGTLKKLFDND